MKLGGCAINWNYGFYLGFGNFFLYIIIFGLGYIMLGLCMAEMISVMSFDGGYYGYARVLMGPFGGYLVGCFGLIESVFYFASFPLKICEFIQIIFTIHDNYRLIILFFLYLGFFFSFIKIQYRFWDFIKINSAVVIILFLIFFLGSIPAMDYRQYALINSGKDATDELKKESVPISVLFFMGFDLISLVSHEVKNVRLFVWILCFLFLICFHFSLFSFLSH
jgi:amino acid transporter